MKNAYLDTCSWEVKERYSEQQDILDFTPIDIERKTRFTMLKEELACCEQDSVLTVLIRLFWNVQRKISLRTRF